MVIDAAELAFLSSAGIRSLLILHKELRAVAGDFSLVNAYGMVRETLTCSGFAQWLAGELPRDLTSGQTLSEEVEQAWSGCEIHILDTRALVSLTSVSAWTPWNPVDRDTCRLMRCTQDGFGLGIGCAAREYDPAREHLGEFVAVSGHVVHQPPSDRARPDYLLAEKDFVPTLLCSQALFASGPMSHLIRFTPGEEEPVGASLIRSPGEITPGRDLAFPELRDWLRFCGERSFAHEQALITGVVAPSSRVPSSDSLSLLPSRPDLSIHAHGAVFPYQPLPAGVIELRASVEKWLSGPAPRAVMHLVDDHRPGMGLGETGLLRGALWCSPIANPEVLS
jgi:hypothetical protein